MRIKIMLRFYVLFLLLIVHQSNAQNLVPNPGFETTLASPSAAGQWNLAQPWDGINGTPDLYGRNQVSLPLLPCDNVNIPTNAGGFCDERTGQNHYMGLQFDLINNQREYIPAPFVIPLNNGDIYRIEFYLQRADSSRFACNRIGALLSNNIPIQPGTGVINFIPQLEALAQVTDTAGWTKVTGVYQAFGGENYITIGIFRNDNDPQLFKTDYGTTTAGCTAMNDHAYYYIDDIAVTPVNVTVQIEGDTVICPGQTTVLTANSNVPFWWSSSDFPNDTGALSVDTIITPNAPVTYYLNTDFKTDSVRILIVNPPVVNLGPDTLLCEGDTIFLDATAPDGLLYTWSTGDTSSIIAVTDTGTYSVLVDNLGCSTEDSVVIPAFLENPLLTLGEDSSYCFFYNDSLTLDGGVGISYLWQPTLETSREITVLVPGIYSVSVGRANGCRRTATLEVQEICEPTVFVPNAFTPDDDGLNDIFRPYVNNVLLYNFRVINRRGQIIFYSENPSEGWDGTYDGQDSPIGVYVFRVNYEGLDEDGIKVKKKMLGTVTLIR
ncbi:MAG: gliding motility-associated C-terminal domain-containing protein [Bacteroidetes bacterium]|nr:gliding motility-associated C-terminal domain-containing protein [Bacteroidota bacterium]